jgi:hypothetical protein
MTALQILEGLVTTWARWPRKDMAVRNGIDGFKDWSSSEL